MSRFLIISVLSLGAALLAHATAVEEGVLYSPVGKRDPFRAPSSLRVDRQPAANKDISQYGIDQLKLRAILRGGAEARVMFEDPEGHTYILRKGDVIGREQGKISRILNTDVIVTERTFNYLGAENLYERVISLPADR